MNHILLECYCLKETERYAGEKSPAFCAGKKEPTYDCLKHRCKYLDFTSCENTLCYIDDAAEMAYGIIFGGEMTSHGEENGDIARWRNTAIEKIDEAYDVYMKERKV